MIIRRYRPLDCAQMADLFYHTVHAVNAKDYSQEQLCAWADGKINLEEWNRSFSEHFTIVAAEQDKIIGFGDMDLSVIWIVCMCIRISKGKGLQPQSAMHWSKLFLRTR